MSIPRGENRKRPVERGETQVAEARSKLYPPGSGAEGDKAARRRRGGPGRPGLCPGNRVEEPGPAALLETPPAPRPAREPGPFAASPSLPHHQQEALSAWAAPGARAKKPVQRIFAGDEESALLEPPEHATIFSALEQLLAGAHFAALARALNFIIIRGTYDEFMVIFNLQSLDRGLHRLLLKAVDSCAAWRRTSSPPFSSWTRAVRRTTWRATARGERSPSKSFSGPSVSACAWARMFSPSRPPPFPRSTSPSCPGCWRTSRP